MRRVFILSASLESGGAERQLAVMANHWAAAGSDVELATWTGAGVADFFALDARVRRTHFDVPLFPPPFAALRNLLARVARLRERLRQARPDVLVSFITETNVIALLAARGLPIRVVVSERAHPQLDDTISRPLRMLRRILYRRAAAVVTQTEAAAGWVREHCVANVAVVPNTLRESAANESPREPLLLAVGRLRKQKGFDLLLRAFARLDPPAPWRLVIVGEGPEHAALQALRNSLRLGDRVEFRGVERDIARWMARAGIVVAPSRFEGFPNVVLEAMAEGAPVISADCLAGPSEMITDGVDGLLVPVEDVGALATAIGRLIRDADERARLGRAARTVRTRYSTETVMPLWNEIVFAGRRP
ncbi:MAG TPA: glycosyltransferase family 4 protein [Steroidobacteraceae bacterium]|nr:glycosyltransferase family 4 protein [Steroidobacteraceae bacterium]